MAGGVLRYGNNILRSGSGVIREYVVPSGPSYPTSGLIERWSLNNTLTGLNGKTWIQNSGSTIYDTGHVASKCLSFNASSDFKITGDSTLYGVFTGTNSYSISTWIKSTQYNTGGYYWIFTQGDGTKNVVLIGDILQNKLTFARYIPSVAIYEARSSVAGTDGNWKHIVYTFDGTNMRGYFNTELKAGPTAGNSASINATDLYLGGYLGTSQYEGLLDTFYIYNKVLSTEEIAQLYNGGAGV